MSTQAPAVFVQVVLYNSVEQHSFAAVEKCLRSLPRQSGYRLGENLQIHVRDNGSSDEAFNLVQQRLPECVTSCRRNQSNLGFSGAFNQGIKDFLDTDCRYFLALNPDVVLSDEFIGALAAELERSPAAGSACGRLYRADENLEPAVPLRLDSAGMYVTPALRHFDRGSNQPDGAEFDRDCWVFGSTGACWMMRREFIEDLLLDDLTLEADAESICRPLAEHREERRLLFDEAFFAYREDADLAWRGQLLGWRCRYVARAVGYHRRVVLPERRALLRAELNLYGVRNRFLLQLNNYSIRACPAALLPGVLFRNLLVIAAVLIWERGSLPALRQVQRLYRRALERRRAVLSRAKGLEQIGRWFRYQPYIEDIREGL